MICESCRVGSSEYASDDPMWRLFHAKCRGETHCDCQHVPIPRVRPVTREEKSKILRWADDVESFVERQRGEVG